MAVDQFIKFILTPWNVVIDTKGTEKKCKRNKK